MKENISEVLESYKISFTKNLERAWKKKLSKEEIDIVKNKEKELSEKKPIEIARLVVSKIKSDLVNSPKWKELLKEMYDAAKEDCKDGEKYTLVNISGFQCMLCTKDDNFEYIEVPVKNEDGLDEPVQMMLALDQIAVILSI